MKKLILSVIILSFTYGLQAQVMVGSNNNVGVGLSSTGTPQNTLDVNGNIQISKAIIPMGLMMEVGGTTPLLNLSLNFREPNYNSSYLGGSFRIDTRNTSTMPLFQWWGRKASSNELLMMELNISGQLGIGKHPSCSLDVNGTIMSNGTVVTSDARLKNNISDIIGPLASLTRLHGVNYKLNLQNSNMVNLATNSLSQSDSTGTKQVSLHGIDSVFYNRNHMGFLAQEIQTVFPDLVYTNKDGMLSVDYVSLIPLLVESIKEQQAVISDLKAAVEDLKKKLNSK